MLILVIEAKCYSLRGVSSEPTTTGRSLLPRKWRCRTMADQTGPRHSTLWSRGWARALTPKRRPVSHPRSSNRTCPIKASGFPTGFTARPTNEDSLDKHHFIAEVTGAARLHRRLVLRLATQLDLKFPDLTRCCQTHRQSPLLPFFTKHTRSKGPFLRRHYPASSVVWPSPTPRLAAALSGDVRGRDPQPIPSLPH